MSTTENLIGKKIKVKSNLSGHGILLGTIGIIEKVQGSQVYLKGNPSWLDNRDFEIIPITREEIQKNILSLQEKVKSEQEKLQFMSDNNVDEFDETQYKVFRTLATLDNKDISDMEKSKLIADLIKK
jgi:hypothetical protein